MIRTGKIGILLALSVLMLAGQVTAASARELIDLAGRTVTVPDHVDRIILGEGRFLPALAIVEPDDPVALLAGIMSDLQMLDPATYGQYAERFPALRDVPAIGRSTADSFSLEQAISLAPQVAIFGTSGGHGPNPRNKALIDTLEAAGIAIVFVDFREQPFRNTPRSIALLGELLGHSERAAAFNAEYQAQVDALNARLARVAIQPDVFLESRVGLHDQCCETMGSKMLGRFITMAGGRNIAEDIVPGVVGTVSVEYLLEAQPDHYIATAIGSATSADPQDGRVILGGGADPEQARASLRQVMQRPGLDQLGAVRQNRVHSIWHHFYNSPFNIAAVQALAKWLHPEAMADVSPDAVLAKFYDEFQPVALAGVYWITLSEPDEESGG